MKTLRYFVSSLAGKWAPAQIAAVVLASACGSLPALAADPVGTWDCVVSGAEQGVAFLTFGKDTDPSGNGFVLSGFEVITHYQPPQSDPRGSGGNVGRTNEISSGTNLFFFGFTPLSGVWNFDAKGRPVGFITEGADLGEGNAISASFVAIVREGRRITLKVTDSPNSGLLGSVRHSVYRGVPFEPAQDISGGWFANGKVVNSSNNVVAAKQTFTEFFQLTSISSLLEDSSFLDQFPFFGPLTNSEAVANAYFYSGTGPGYTNAGLALLSIQKRVATVTRQDNTTDTNSALRALSGPINLRRNSMTLFGTDDAQSRISFKATKY